MSPEETPDFDSMSPEEMMEWMETLAKRQGVSDEQLTTSASMSVAEVDPDSVDMGSLGEYIPSGWTKEDWEAHLAEEEAEKAARAAAVDPAPTIEQPEPVAEIPDPSTPEPVAVTDSATASADDGMPDIDSMSPEEMMEWMESLAKRQGVSDEQLTTSASMDVAEVDPDSVDMDSLGEYIPSGWTKEDWEAHLAEEEAEKAAPAAAVESTPVAEEPEPVVETPELADLDDVFPDLGLDEDEVEIPDELPVLDFDNQETEPAPAAAADPMSWLEDLAGEEAVDMPDLSGLEAASAELAGLDTGAEAVDPMAWLESLAEEEASEPVPSLDLDDLSGDLMGISDLITPEIGDPVSPLDTNVDPVEWIESLAARQGAPEDELTTSASLDILSPAEVQPEGPGYEDYTFEDSSLEDTQPALDPLSAESGELDLSQLENPEDWLDALAESSGSPAAPLSPIDEGNVLDKLGKGEDVAPEDMQAVFNQWFDRAEQEEQQVPEVDPNAPAVQAELPDWLLEQMGSSPIEADAMVAEPTEPIVEEVPDALMDDILGDEPVAEAELPDWLQENAEVTSEGIDDIFADVEPEIPAPISATPIDSSLIDSDDSWVQAFDMEKQEAANEAWYQQRLSEIESGEVSTSTPIIDEPADAPVILSPVSVQLEEATFPEELDVPIGQPEAVPDWLSEAAPAASASMPSGILDEEAPAEMGEIPDWLSSAIEDDSGADVSEDALPDWLAEAGVEDVSPEEIPDWLHDTVTEDSVAAIPESPAILIESSPVPVPAAPPAPVLAVTPAADVSEALQNGRSKISDGDIDGALLDFESVIRANQELDGVIADLRGLLKDQQHKGNPAVYRVLGDGLMRKGELQAALDTYRRALNLL